MTRRIVFVTGGAGFVGSNVVARLARDLSLDLVVCDSLGGVDSGKWRNIAKHPIGDVVAPADMFDWLEKRWREVEMVVHMAAVTTNAETDVDAVVQGNFGLSRDLFRWCADRQRRLVWASSSQVYGDGSAGFADSEALEDLAALRPTGPIGWSKALFDFFAVRQALRDYAPPQWAGLRLFSAYGPNEQHKGPHASLAAEFYRAASRGRSVQIFRSHREGIADGEQSRDFTHVEDAAAVVEWLLGSPQVNGVYNLGSGRARSLNDLARLVFAATGQPPKIDYVEAPEAIRSGYRYRVEAPLERLREAGFTAPMSSLEDGIEAYVGGYLMQPDPHR
jgi:ADP-L-glycero-D-manno-heptose 6-epimerase